jgi:hypothetical protein
LRNTIGTPARRARSDSAPGRAEDQAVDAALEQVHDFAPLDLGIAAAAGEKEAVAQG